jgi:hypothetical protein
MVVEGDWPGRMPKKAVVEKTKDQLSAQKVPARLIFFSLRFGVDALRNPPTLSPPFA